MTFPVLYSVPVVRLEALALPTLGSVVMEYDLILSQLGLPVSVLINSLYRQIIMRGGVPFSMTVPSHAISRDTMSDADFNAMMSVGLQQAKANESISLNDAMNDLLRGI